MASKVRALGLESTIRGRPRKDSLWVYWLFEKVSPIFVWYVSQGWWVAWLVDLEGDRPWRLAEEGWFEGRLVFVKNPGPML